MTAIDLFAGCGGFTTGAEMAGVKVLWAANHWDVAVQFHSSNHPLTNHSCQDLHQTNWETVPKHDIMLASPACQGHSRARGADKPRHDASRSTAWAIISCAEYHRPPFIVVENVPEFSKWQLFGAWHLALRKLGYSISAQVVDAADCGVPQHRKRVIIIATQSKSALWLNLPKREHKPASGIICTDALRWSPVETKCVRTQQRIAKGRTDHGENFLIAYYGSEHGGRSLNRPIGTVTTRDRYALVHGDSMRMLCVKEYRAAMGFPSSYKLPANHRLATHMLGNAVCPPVARDVLQQITIQA